MLSIKNTVHIYNAITVALSISLDEEKNESGRSRINEISYKLRKKRDFSLANHLRRTGELIVT